MRPDLDLSLIVAMTPDGLIGKDGRLPWHLPSDRLRLRQLTTNGAIVMGRKKFESILTSDRKPLPGRQLIVLTKNRRIRDHPWVQFACSLEVARLKIAILGGRAYIIGGEQIYHLFLSEGLVRRMYVTVVEVPDSLVGDKFFPKEFRPTRGRGWRIVQNECKPLRRWHADDEYESALHVYERA